ncbi:MAG: hypothetical protein FE045_02325 [Thermoplasmata archaeon]|nr:MAG: hypothetical protein FE045_02325 [Thermoplasmata archaeon]
MDIPAGGVKMKSRKFAGILLVLGIMAILGITIKVNAATIHVPGDYSTIQAAIDAANDGDTIVVAAGTYEEQLTINKNLTLLGESGAKIVAPNNASRNTYKIQESSHIFDPIIFAYGGTYSAGNTTVWGNGVIHVNISGFEIDGNNDGVGDVYAGIFLRNVEGRIYDNYIHNMHVSSGNPQTMCILGYGDSNVRVDNNTVMNYTRGGIVFNGDLGSLPDPYAIVENNTVVGNGLSDGGGWAENGIQIGWEARGIVQYNDVSANGWPGGSWAGTGILIAGTGEVTVRNNNIHNNEASISAVGYEDYKNAPCYNITFENNQVHSNVYGIDVEANVNHVIIEGNTIHDNDYYGVDIWAYNFGWESSTPDNITIQNNEIYNHTYCGVYLSDVYDNISIIQNDIYSNGEAIYLDNYYGVDSDAAIHYNNIHNNIYYGVWNNGNILVDATLNYWGDATGPYYANGNHGGGDNISDNVDYCPWLDAPYPGGNAVGPVQNINTGEYFCTIQDAINDADTLDGHTIIVSAGIYDEQIIIDKKLTIQGQGNETIIKPSQTTADSFTLFSRKAGGSANTAAIVVANADATIKNLKVDGSEVSSVPSGATFVGILYRGVNGTIDSVTVDNINTSSGIGSNAIYISSMDKEVNVEVKGCTISNFYKNGITANYEGLMVNIHDNNIIGSGPIANVAQNGIQIGLNAEGTVKNNIVNGKGEYYTGSGWTATGILIYAASATIEGNTIINTQTGVLATGDYWGRFSNPWIVSIINNTVDASNLDASQWAIGIAVATYSDGEIINANIEGNQIIGGAASDAGIDIGIAYYGCPGNVIFAVRNNSIGNLDYGMYIEGSVGSGSTIMHNTIQNNAYGIYLYNDADAANVTIHYNNIMGNSDYGVYNNGTGILNATLNYWGHPSGPHHPSNPSYMNGTGDNVSDYVEFTPWLNDEGKAINYWNPTSTGTGSQQIDETGDANVILEITTTSSVNITIQNYSENPTGVDLPGGMQAVGHYIDVNISNISAVDWSKGLRIEIYYTEADLNALNITEAALKGMYYWNGSAWHLYDETGVDTADITIGGKAYAGHVWAIVHDPSQLSPKVIGGGGAGDLLPPTSWHVPSWLGSQNAKPTTSISIYAKDDDSLWYRIYCIVDNGPEIIGDYNKTIDLGTFSLGLHTIEYWAVDSHGHEEQHHVVTFYVTPEDGVTPALSFDGPHEFIDGVWHISPDTKIFFDENILALNGISEVYYGYHTEGVENVTEWMQYRQPFTLPLGYYHLLYYGIDKIGYHTPTVVIRVSVEASHPPETSLITDPSIPDGNNGWYVSNVVVSFVASDADGD